MAGGLRGSVALRNNSSYRESSWGNLTSYEDDLTHIGQTALRHFTAPYHISRPASILMRIRALGEARGQAAKWPPRAEMTN